VAPIFSSVNIASDQNLMLMELMTRVARRHNLKALFHEKPFAHLNGSGKHNNWSVGTNAVGTAFNPGAGRLVVYGCSFQLCVVDWLPLFC
jgi:glutamine synthetase